MKDVYLLDLSYIFRRHWHVSANKPVSTSYEGTLNEVREWCSSADYAAVCIDSPPYLRKEIYPDYKANREQAPQQMFGEIDRVIAKLRDDGFFVIGSEGYEADDIIATFANALQSEHRVTVVTGDKDALQMVSDQVKVMSPATGSLMDADAVEEKFGVPPSKMIEWLALVGDKSDNIPGVEGCGPKTAAEWLGRFESLEGIFQNISKLTDKKQESLVAAADMLKTARELIRLRTDAPIDVQEIFADRAAKPIKVEDEEPPPPDDADEPAPGVQAEPSLMEEVAAKIVPAMKGRGGSEWLTALEPKNQAQAWDLAQRLYKSRMFSQYPTVESIYAAILTGRELGLGAMASVRAFHVMDNKLTLGAWPMVGVVLRSPLCDFFREVHGDSTKSIWETRRTGGKVHRFEYTIDDAQKAGLVRKSRNGKPGNWMLRPADMLSKTAASKLARKVYSDVILGLYSTEEMEGVAA